MAEKSGLYNSVGGDRMYDAEDIGAFLAPFFNGGIFANPSTNLQVTADGSGMTVTIQPGFALIKTADFKLHMYQVTSPLTLPISTADGALNRIDRIVARHDTANRLISAQVKKGVYASSPVAQNVEQDADYWELALADIYVGAGATKITQSNITDQRLNTAVCGVVAATVQQLDTTALFTQYQTWLTEQIAAHASDNTAWQTQMANDLAAFQAQFTAWFNTIKGQLGTDVAGNLQIQINNNASYQTAVTGSTGTAIILPALVLVDGREIKWIAPADNGSAATTINNIPLYKPGTTTPPKITAGQPCVAYYNATNNCFFYRSSGIDISDATTAASTTLSPYVGYDKDGNKFTGSILSKGSQTYIPGTTDQTIAAQQFLAGVQTIKGDSQLIAANIKNGVKLFQGTSGEIDGSLISSQKANASFAYSGGYNGLITVNTLSFTPKWIFIKFQNLNNFFTLYCYDWNPDHIFNCTAGTFNTISIGIDGQYINSTGFSLHLAYNGNASDIVQWYAES